MSLIILCIILCFIILFDVLFESCEVINFWLLLLLGIAVLLVEYFDLESRLFSPQH